MHKDDSGNEHQQPIIIPFRFWMYLLFLAVVSVLHLFTSIKVDGSNWHYIAVFILFVLKDTIETFIIKGKR